MFARTFWLVAVLGIATSVIADLGAIWKKLSQTKKGYFEATSSYPVFSGTNEVVRLANAEIAKRAKTDFDRFLRDAKQGAAELGKPTMAWAYESKTVVALATDSLVSVYFDRYEYSGGAHPNTFQAPLTFGKIGGKAKRLTLKDVVKPGSVESVMAQVVKPRLDAAKRTRGADPVDSIDKELAESFVVTRAGMTWLFPPYSVGPYVEGAYEVKVPWSDLTSYLVPSGPLAGAGR